MELYRRAPAAGLLSQSRGRSTAGSFVLETKLSQIRASEASWCLVLPCFKCPLAAFQHTFLSVFTTCLQKWTQSKTLLNKTGNIKKFICCFKKYQFLLRLSGHATYLLCATSGGFWEHADF